VFAQSAILEGTFTGLDLVNEYWWMWVRYGAYGFFNMTCPSGMISVMSVSYLTNLEIQFLLFSALHRYCGTGAFDVDQIAFIFFPIHIIPFA